MYDMPESVKALYKSWINAFPASWHQYDLERFYMFISVLLARGRKFRSANWLERNIREDRPDMPEEIVERYCTLYEHLRDFKLVWKSQQAKLMAIDEQKKALVQLQEDLEQEPKQFAQYNSFLENLGQPSLEATRAFLAGREAGEPEEGLTPEIVERLRRRIDAQKET